ncbi:AMP-binding protein [Phaeobacter sp. G2]|nr:AMP-binding protein [Phaeobacter sp. G2]
MSEPSAAGLILHTSGTTARPKMVQLSQQNLAISCGNIAQSVELNDLDISLCSMPLFHIHGWMAGQWGSSARSWGSSMGSLPVQKPVQILVQISAGKRIAA